MYKGRMITVVIPALNEEPSIGRVLDGLTSLQTCDDCWKLNPSGSCQCSGYISVVDQIIVCDNGSTDNTAGIAKAYGAIVTEEPERGYGAACLAALAVPVEKDIVVFVDGDHSVVAEELPELLDPLVEGADLVIGSRTLGVTEKGALSIPQAFGNHLASALMRFLWRANVTDLGPFRAITNSALLELQMSDRKFGWTVEMQVLALQKCKSVVEVPVSTRRRIGHSKISGTLRGVIGAAHGILGTIAKLYFRGLVSGVVSKFSIQERKSNNDA